MWPTEKNSEGLFTDPTHWCPDPERWHSTDSDSTEIEVSRLVAAFVTALRPDLVIETGSAWGQTSAMIGHALTATGQGHLITCEVDPERVTATRERCHGLPVFVEPRPSLEVITDHVNARDEKDRPVRFAFLDSLLDLRVPELEAIRPLLAPGAIVGIHDCGDPVGAKFRSFSAEVATAAERMGFSRLSLPTPRGVTFLGWSW